MQDTAKQLNVAVPTRVREAAFLFADIVGFTAFTEQHSDERAAELAWRLRLGVERELGHDAHVVKTLGDAVMVRIAEPGEAAAVGLRIVARALSAPGDPPVRVGVHCGTAVECDGDFFGAAVNVAARVAALAGPGDVLVTGDVARAARGHGLQISFVGERSLRNVASPVAVHAVQEAAPLRCAQRRERRGRHGQTRGAHGTLRARLAPQAVGA
jgi:adenylate cyclase